jgi:hypothetical protein
MQDTPASVPHGAGQAGDTQQARERRSRWRWAEAMVWTDRMLAALENGVKGDVWFSLIDKVYNPRKFVFHSVDRWVRQRLRGILRKRRKRQGRARGKDFNRWPNAFFAKQGLYALTEAAARERQSAKAAH